LQVKDRHNANILIDKEGHIIHIDFGFMLTNSPLKGMALENAPFKLNSDFIEVLGGEDSEGFRRFRGYFQR
jgi:phosphatidylinositol 4-kinase B